MRKGRKKENAAESTVIFLSGCALFVYSLVKFHASPVKIGWMLSPYLFPLLLSVCLLFSSILLLFEAGEKREDIERKRDAKKIFVMLFMGIGYSILINTIRFVPATAVFLVISMRYLGEKNLKKTATVAVLTPCILCAIFEYLLHVRLP